MMLDRTSDSAGAGSLPASPLSERVTGPEVLVSPPPVPGLSWRPATRADLPALLDLEVAVNAVDSPDSAVDLDDIASRFDAVGFDPELDGIVAVDVEGRVVAYGEAYFEASGEAIATVHLNGHVHPEHRRRGIGSELLAWQEGRGLQHLAGSPLRLPGVLSALVEHEAAAQRAVFARAGFVPARWWLEMERDLEMTIPEVRLDPALRIEPYAARWSEPARAAINAAFRDHWGSQPTSREEWDEAQKSDDFRPGWSAVAVATLPDHTEVVVGAITVETDEDEWALTGYPFATVDELGVLSEWRGRGIAKALLTWSMRDMHAAGIARATLDVDDASPTGAQALYGSLGFVETGRSVTYAKTFA
ncbi:GNAT family N-acetyltransferase [Microbacterium sp. ZW T5_56]|uniref:GNAT family N-acetyltransferase n=1 Tax=Microbacterium sp. ZW T5_56 TaxID=3378081 RepID=UPI0038528395